MRIIGGKYRAKKLFTPQDNSVRPTADRTRESVFNILNSRLEKDWSDYHLLDVFAGSGAFGLEALSRGISSVTFLDINPKLCQKNINLFPQEKDKIRIISADATKLPFTHLSYNLVFSDAPYKKGLSSQALIALAQQEWLDDGALCVIETEKKETLDLPEEFSIDDERLYGLAKISFLTYHK